MSISQLSEESEQARPHVSETVGELSAKNLVRTHRDGKYKIVEAEQITPIQIFRDVVRQNPHVDFSELLHGKALRVLYYLDSPTTVSEIAEKTEEHRNTVHRIVKRFQNRGMVAKDAGTYVLNDDFTDLCRFSRALSSHLHIVRTPIAAGTILWETPDEFLVQAEATVEDPDFFLTGPSKLHEFGIPLVTTDRRYYFYSERLERLGPADVICHTLLIDDSARYRMYCLLLLAKSELPSPDLSDRAVHYGVTKAVKELVQYLQDRGQGEFESMISWEEFEQTAASYGIEL